MFSVVSWCEVDDDVDDEVLAVCSSQEDCLDPILRPPNFFRMSSTDESLLFELDASLRSQDGKKKPGRAGSRKSLHRRIDRLEV